MDQQTDSVEKVNLSCSCESLLQDSLIKQNISQSNITDLSSNSNANELKPTQQILKKSIKKSSRKKKAPENRILSIKDIKIKGLQLYVNIELSKVFPIEGDYFVNLDYDKKLTIEEQINIFKGLKQIQMAIKDDKRQMVILDIITSDQMEYAPQQVVQQAIIKRQDPLLFSFLDIIQEYYKTLSLYTNMQQRLNQVMAQTAQENLIERRRKYFDEKMEEFIKQNYNDTDFFLYYKYQQRNREDPYMQYRQVGVSYPLIALLGTDPQSFTNISMRNGFLEFSSNFNKQLMIIHSMACRLDLVNHGAAHINHVIKDMVLLTFDEYEIYTQMAVTCYKFDYPPELQMEVDGYKFVHEIPVLLKYLIDENTLSSLIAKRAKNPQFQQSWENEYFGYTLESQIFLEKFYKNTIDNLKDSKYEHQLKYYYNKQCGFRTLEQVQENDSSCCSHYQKMFCS